MVLPVRANLDAIKRFMIGDCYIGRGSRQRGLSKSIFCNTHKVSCSSKRKGDPDVQKDLSTNSELCERLWTLSGLRLVCHCTPNHTCHAHVLVQKFRERYPGAYDRTDTTSTPPAGVLNPPGSPQGRPPSDPGSSADEGGSSGRLRLVGHGQCTTCRNGVHRKGILRRPVAGIARALVVIAAEVPFSPGVDSGLISVQEVCRHVRFPDLVIGLALGNVNSCPSGTTEISELKADIVAGLREHGLKLRTSVRDRQDVLLDYRFIELLLSAARDPEVAIGSFAEGVRVGPGVPLPRLPALYKAKKRWRLPEQSDTWKKGRPVLTHGETITLQLPRSRRKSQRFWKIRQKEDKF